MQGIIHIGDTTTGGGMVLSGFVAIIFGGIGVARQSDPLSCPMSSHGPTESGRASISSLPEAVAS